MERNTTGCLQGCVILLDKNLERRDTWFRDEYVTGDVGMGSLAPGKKGNDGSRSLVDKWVSLLFHPCEFTKHFNQAMGYSQVELFLCWIERRRKITKKDLRSFRANSLKLLQLRGKFIF